MRLEDRILFQDSRPATLGVLSLAGTLTASRGVSAAPMRVLGSYAIVFVVAGGGGYRDGNGLRLPVRAGDAVLLFPELPHAYGPRLLEPRALALWDERYVVFSGPVFDTLRAVGALRPSRPVVPAPPGWGERLRAFMEAHRPPTSSEQALRFAELLVALTPVEALPEGSWTDQARGVLAHDLQNPLDLELCARGFGLSVDAFRSASRARRARPPHATGTLAASTLRSRFFGTPRCRSARSPRRSASSTSST